jgi:hypothetical protein
MRPEEGEEATAPAAVVVNPSTAEAGDELTVPATR